MNDGHSKRKAKILPFINRFEQDRSANLHKLVQKARLMKLEGFEATCWEDSSWLITGGRLVKLTGKNTNVSSFNFHLSPKLGGHPLCNDWASVTKALFILRFHRKHQAVP